MRSEARAACLVLLVTRTIEYCAFSSSRASSILAVEIGSRPCTARPAAAPPAPAPAPGPGTAAAAGRRRGWRPARRRRSLTSSHRNALLQARLDDLVERGAVLDPGQARAVGQVVVDRPGQRRSARRRPCRRGGAGGHVHAAVVDVLAVEQDAAGLCGTPGARSLRRLRLRRNVVLPPEAGPMIASRSRGQMSRRDGCAGPGGRRRRRRNPRRGSSAPRADRATRRQAGGPLGRQPRLLASTSWLGRSAIVRPPSR